MPALQKQEARIHAFDQGIAILKHFREHTSVLSDGRQLDLISLANTVAITNADAREILKVGRRQTCNILAHLVELRLLEKRGHTYHASEYAATLVGALSGSFASILTGRPLPAVTSAWVSLLQMAREGLEVLSARGRVDPSDYDAKSKLLNQLEAELNVKGD